MGLGSRIWGYSLRSLVWAICPPTWNPKKGSTRTTVVPEGVYREIGFHVNFGEVGTRIVGSPGCLRCASTKSFIPHSSGLCNQGMDHCGSPYITHCSSFHFLVQSF